jgi:hypothetical protein
MALSDNLLAYWKLDGDVNDSYGGHDGTATGVTWGTGKLGQAMVMADGSSTCMLSVPGQTHYIELTQRTGWTLSAWVNCVATTVAHCIVGGGGTSGFGWYLGRNSPRFIQWVFSGIVYQFTTAIPTSTWTHVVLTASPGSLMKSYVNGVLDGTTYTPPACAWSVRSLGYDTFPTDGLTGSLDEVGIWNRPLSQAEVATLYNGGTGITYPFASTAGSNFNTGFN